VKIHGVWWHGTVAADVKGPYTVPVWRGAILGIESAVVSVLGRVG
jgi:hypothetical protein